MFLSPWTSGLMSPRAQVHFSPYALKIKVSLTYDLQAMELKPLELKPLELKL
jgi:hypothetical protein